LTTRTGFGIELYPVRQVEDSHVMFQKAVMRNSYCRCLIVGIWIVTNLGSVTLRFPMECCLPVSESLILLIPKSGGRWGSTTPPLHLERVIVLGGEAIFEWLRSLEFIN